MRAIGFVFYQDSWFSPPTFSTGLWLSSTQRDKTMQYCSSFPFHFCAIEDSVGVAIFFSCKRVHFLPSPSLSLLPFFPVEIVKGACRGQRVHSYRPLPRAMPPMARIDCPRNASALSHFFFFFFPAASLNAPSGLLISTSVSVFPSRHDLPSQQALTEGSKVSSHACVFGLFFSFTNRL